MQEPQATIYNLKVKTEPNTNNAATNIRLLFVFYYLFFISYVKTEPNTNNAATNIRLTFIIVYINYVKIESSAAKTIRYYLFRSYFKYCKLNS